MKLEVGKVYKTKDNDIIFIYYEDSCPDAEMIGVVAGNRTGCRWNREGKCVEDGYPYNPDKSGLDVLEQLYVVEKPVEANELFKYGFMPKEDGAWVRIADTPKETLCMDKLKTRYEDLFNTRSMTSDGTFTDLYGRPMEDIKPKESLSRRDQFAIAALVAVISKVDDEEPCMISLSDIAVHYADCLIAELAKEKS